MVWSDEEVQELSREFVTVTDEVYMLYPEDEWNLKRVADTPQQASACFCSGRHDQTASRALSTSV